MELQRQYHSPPCPALGRFLPLDNYGLVLTSAPWRHIPCGFHPAPAMAQPTRTLDRANVLERSSSCDGFALTFRRALLSKVAHPIPRAWQIFRALGRNRRHQCRLRDVAGGYSAEKPTRSGDSTSWYLPWKPFWVIADLCSHRLIRTSALLGDCCAHAPFYGRDARMR